ncbi:hypothetical protein [Granulicella sp. S190]|uniref:hypothetical protein n=1 Tax=Granulicella sp. S190 TaxID=1747226 RepID=UPI00131EB7A6|nr:hypothetical protein [Granulicella sp. S190]
MRPLILTSVISFFLSVLLLVAVYTTRRKYFAYASHAFMILSYFLVSVMNIQRHNYALSIVFAALEIVWLYKLSVGEIVAKSLL